MGTAKPKARASKSGKGSTLTLTEARLDAMTTKQLKRLLQVEHAIEVPEEVLTGATADGDHKTALRDFAKKLLFKRSKFVAPPSNQLADSSTPLVDAAALALDATLESAAKGLKYLSSAARSMWRDNDAEAADEEHNDKKASHEKSTGDKSKIKQAIRDKEAVRKGTAPSTNGRLPTKYK